jgi:hypothetical protein
MWLPISYYFYAYKRFLLAGGIRSAGISRYPGEPAHPGGVDRARGRSGQGASCCCPDTPAASAH